MGFRAQFPLIKLTPQPELEAGERQLTDYYHEYAMRPQNGGYDDQILFAHGYSSGDTLCLFTAPFSWFLALLSNESPSFNNKVHALAAGCLVTQGGRVLVSQRSLTMTVRPGVWSWSAAGAINIEEYREPWLAAEREAEEEIGLKNIEGQRFLGHGVIAHPEFTEHWLITQFLVNNFRPEPDPREVATSKWITNITEVSPVTKELVAWWPQLSALVNAR